MTAIRAALICIALLLIPEEADAFCRTPEAIISGFDHRQIQATFTPLYGPAAMDTIAEANVILAASGLGERVEGDAALVAEPDGDPLFYVYLFRDNCHIGSAWFSREFINLVLGKGA
jgi:hypothetical protein